MAKPKGVSWARRLMISFSSAVTTFVALIVVIAIAALWAYDAPGPAAIDNGPTTTVVLRPHSGLGEISSTLEQAHVIRSSALFMAAAQLTGAAHHLKAGEYEFPTRASMAQVMEKIRKGLVVRHFVTIPEGVSSEAAIDILMAHDELVGSAPVPPEGSILPETYEVRRGDDRGAVLNRMMAARDKLLDELWAQRAPDLPLKSPEEAVILASIVEKETAKADERPMIARVFLNRLEKGMPLETDPTVIYGITHGRPLGRPLNTADLKAPTPFNTYIITGLPPTPISNPGRESLAAVMSPPQGDWLYFVANGTGGHSFASTFEQHQANVAKWRQIEHAGEAPPPPKAKPARKTKAKHRGR